MSWDQEQPAVFLLIIKDFNVDDPQQAEPAPFTIADERGPDATFAIDNTVQLDFYSVSFGASRDRTKKITTLVGDVRWQPGLRFGRFSTNQRLPLGRLTLLRQAAGGSRTGGGDAGS